MSKSNSNKWSTSGILIYLVQFARVITLFWLLMYPVVLLLQILDLTAISIFKLDMTVHLQGLNSYYEFYEQQYPLMHNQVVTLEFTPLGYPMENKWLYYLAYIMQIGLYAAIFYGLTLIKNILSSLKQNNPWDEENSSRLRIISYLLLIAFPYMYSIDWLAYLIAQELSLPTKIHLVPPFFPEWSLLIAGFIVLLVAHLFKQGTRIYEEQKLTI
ncbi:DUF2975 domain-containing protein [Balneolaceae bacterium YR4-1]|uniref:DUF2975 domain-containing protein n=1 Tax=Halalkalibaculum roseum TaxID=2709311 RepID=A0A6M1SR31_9BACT|nr:DUF2975 domain-containing protein [Halalkalibaculum roseum]NGP75182.1 DUF2975 domain-containing protein [Halalkalibaculum roseum]